MENELVSNIEINENMNNSNSNAEDIDSGKNECQRSIDFYVNALQHSVNCTNISCQSYKCTSFKRIISHTKICTEKIACNYCRQFIALCIYHAKRCTASDPSCCNIPFCASLRIKFLVKKSSELINEKIKLLQYKKDIGVQTDESDEKSNSENDEIENQKNEFIKIINNLKSNRRGEAEFRLHRAFRTEMVKYIFGLNVDAKNQDNFKQINNAVYAKCLLNKEEFIVGCVTNMDEYLWLIADLIHENNKIFKKVKITKKEVSVQVSDGCQDLNDDDQECPVETKRPKLF